MTARGCFGSTTLLAGTAPVSLEKPRKLGRIKACYRIANRHRVTLQRGTPNRERDGSRDYYSLTSSSSFIIDDLYYFLRDDDNITSPEAALQKKTNLLRVTKRPLHRNGCTSHQPHSRIPPRLNNVNPSHPTTPHDPFLVEWRRQRSARVARATPLSVNCRIP